MTSESSGTVMGTLRGWREYIAPTLKKTAFLERGVLTPEEFVRAGDELVFRCPAWCWERGTNPPKSYLPEDKQFLVTRNVPCPTRVSDMEAQLGLIQQINNKNGDDEDEDDWLISTLVKTAPNASSLEDEFDILDQEGQVVIAPPENENEEKPTEEEEEDEYADMVDFEDSNVLVDEDAAAPVGDDNTNLLKVRTYDLSITYDKYYQTPRVWMVGRSAEGQPLTGKEMMEDVMTDYANKTVTIEVHPHVSGPHASIHPCKHGKVMKTIVDNLMASSQQQQTDGNESSGPSIEMYLFIFLKFVSSIIPTIAYDFTMEVNTGNK